MDESKFILDLIKNSNENEWIEFKSNYIDPQKLWETISALANTACLHQQNEAFLIFWVDDVSKEIIGTSFNISKQKWKWNEDLEPWLYRNLQPSFDLKIKEVSVWGKLLVVFFVPPAVNWPVKFNQKEYIRVWSHIHTLVTYPEKEAIIWERRKLFESRIAMENILAQDIPKFLNQDQYFKLIWEVKPQEYDSVIQRFIEEWFVIKQKWKLHISNLWAILLAEDLKFFPKLEWKAIRIITYKDNNRLHAIKDIIGNKWYAVGFENSIGYIVSQIPDHETIEWALRITRESYPIQAIREFLANALVHQDFSTSWAWPLIEIFSNRIEISNPWLPLIDPYRFIDSIPISRNEKLTDTMRRMNICEKRWSWVDRAILAIELAQLPPPDIQNIDHWVRITIHWYKQLNDLTKEEKMRACYFHSCLKHVIDQEPMSNSSFSERLGIEYKNKAITSRIIKDTINKGLIKPFDPDSKSLKYAKYIPFRA